MSFIDQKEITDRYIEEYSVWIVELSNGQRFVQYDVEERSWDTLRDYCYNNNVYITDMWVRFRSHWEYVGNGRECDGFFFVNGIQQYIGMPPSNYLVVGYVKNNKVYSVRYKVPELIKDDHQIRNINDIDPRCLNLHPPAAIVPKPSI